MARSLAILLLARRYILLCTEQICCCWHPAAAAAGQGDARCWPGRNAGDQLGAVLQSNCSVLAILLHPARCCYILLLARSLCRAAASCCILLAAEQLLTAGHPARCRAAGRPA